jgi:hypothetical protein
LRDWLAKLAGRRPRLVEVLWMAIAGQIGEQPDVATANGSLARVEPKADRVGTQVCR